MFVWGSEGDAEECCFSSLCMVELVGESHFKRVEYGSSVSYVINLEGVQCPNLLIHCKYAHTLWSEVLVCLGFSG